MSSKVITGDVREVLPTLAEASIDCVVTSPPYWGLRDYKVAGQMGLEPSPDVYIAGMVAVFREVRRVLKPTGTLWLNMGDMYRDPRRLYTDIDASCCAVLEERRADGDLPPGLVLRADVRELSAGVLCGFEQIHLFAGIGGSPLGLKWAGWPDEWSIVTGGFPCQDISSAGKGAGLDGKRSGLFWELCRVVELKRPMGVLAENVGALSARGLDRVAGALESLGYWVEALRVGSWSVGAPDKRERWWFVCRRVGDEHSAGRRADDAPDEHEGSEAVARSDVGHHRRRRSVADLNGAESPQPATSRRGASGGTATGTSHRRRLVQAEQQGREGLRHDAGTAQEPQPRDAGEPRRWPHPRWYVLDKNGREKTVPTPQHEWEPPRLHPGTRTVNARWRLALMGYPLHWLDIRAERLTEVSRGRKNADRWWNKQGVAMTGNAQNARVVAAIARGMIESLH